MIYNKGCMIEKESVFEYREQESRIRVRRSGEASSEVKENPFYDPEIWGQVKSPDNIYLPDSDEAISFAIAA